MVDDDRHWRARQRRRELGNAGPIHMDLQVPADVGEAFLHGEHRVDAVAFAEMAHVVEAHAAEPLRIQLLQFCRARGSRQQRHAAIVAVCREQIGGRRVVELMHGRLHDHAALDAKMLMQREQRFLRRIRRRRVAALGGERKARAGAEDVEMRVARALWQGDARLSRIGIERRCRLGHDGRNDSMAKTPLGKLKSTAIGLTEFERLPASVLKGYRALEDLTGTTSDALDELHIDAVVPASALKPSDPSARIVGQALTVLNRKSAERRKTSGLADIEAHNLAQAGDVLVVQGVAGISSMGGVSASIGKRQGEIAAIVDGAVRDIDHSRSIGYPIWSAGVSPITGKWRIETMGVNQPVRIAGIEVKPGDLVVADECGVCFVPFARAAEVLGIAQRLAASEKARLEKLATGMPLSAYIKLPR